MQGARFHARLWSILIGLFIVLGSSIGILHSELSSGDSPTSDEMTLHEGDMAPDFSLPDQSGTVHSLSQYRGKKLVLYFYPKDLTPGCTAEACSFRDNLARVTSAGAAVVGISADSVKQHGKFAAKESINFPILADEGAAVSQRYGVWKEKTMYGKTFMGIERTTFVIDEKGKIIKIFPRVKVEGHVEEVLRALAG